MYINIIHQLAVYTTYIPLIVLAFLVDYMLPIPPIKGTRFHSIDQISSDIKALSPLSADRIASIATRPL